MSSAVYPIHGGSHNVLQLTHNMLATENITVTQVWATTLVPTSSPVPASVMLVAPQHSGHFPWFLIKSSVINFVWSLQPTPVEQDRRTFALTWADWANAAQFSIEGRIFLLSFRDSAMFWCFKYMVHCRDQVDRHRHHIPELNAKALLDAFLDFKIPAEVPLGVKSGVQGVEVYEQHANIFFCGFPKYQDKGVSTSTVVTANSEYSPPQSPTSEGSNHREDVRPAAAALLAALNRPRTLRSQSIATSDSASGAGEPNRDHVPLDAQPAADALLYLSASDPVPSKKRKLAPTPYILLLPPQPAQWKLSKERPRFDFLERIRLIRHVHDMLLDEMLMVLEQERQGNILDYHTERLTPVDTSGPNPLELKLLELKFHMAIATFLVASIWMIILAAQFVCDGNDLLANASWMSISIASSMIFVVLLTVL
ncbi:hypothetical protein EDD15DRAFT_2367952 [Pisolithus albus]|nr:hypothetical protein EDD15DRAFT_2367952 [Pisolithus albus]